jgi:hypothetical protein
MPLLFCEKVLHSNHSELVQTHIGDYLNPISFHQKTLQIQETSLPHGHSDFVLIYMKLGKLYYIGTPTVALQQWTY